MAAATVDSSKVKSSFLNLLGFFWNRRKTNPSLPIGMQPPFLMDFTIPQTSNDDVNDKVRLFKFPPGAYLDDWRSTPTDMDTNGVPAHVYDILITKEDGTELSTKVVAGSQNARAAAGSDTIAAAAKGLYVGGMYATYKTTTAAAAPVAGTLRCYWKFSIGVMTLAKYPDLKEV